jgi:hypothetical protein
MPSDIRIAIIGAGPAGTTCARELRDKGFNNITIFGNFEDAQSRTMQIDGRTADVGTCYVHSGYWNTVVPLLKRYGLSLNRLPAPTLVDSNMQTQTQSVSERLKMLAGLLYFIFLSFRYLLFYRGTKSPEYSVSMQAYLSARGLDGFSRSFLFGPGGIAQGYGFLDEVTAYGAFQWFRPSIFVTPLAGLLGRGTSTIREGYATLFRKLLSENTCIPVKVTSVTPYTDPAIQRQQVVVRTETGDDYLFDHVVVACRLDRISTPVSPLFTPGMVRSTRFFSFLWQSDTAPWFADRVYIVDYINQKTRNKILTFRTYGQTAEGLHLYWGAGYADESTTKDDLEPVIRDQITTTFGTSITNVPFFEIFDYNLRFSSAAIRENLHLTIRDRQGQGNIWYSGGMLSHWDIDSIMEHNRRLAGQIAWQETPHTWWNRIIHRVQVLGTRMSEI